MVKMGVNEEYEKFLVWKPHKKVHTDGRGDAATQNYILQFYIHL